MAFAVPVKLKLEVPSPQTSVTPASVASVKLLPQPLERFTANSPSAPAAGSVTKIAFPLAEENVSGAFNACVHCVLAGAAMAKPTATPTDAACSPASLPAT